MFLQYHHLQNNQGQSFYASRFSNRDFNFHYHFHPEIELQCITNGHLTEVVGNDIIQLKKGDVIVIGANTPHFLHNEPGDSQGDDWARISLVLFREDVFGGTFQQAPEFSSARTFLQNIAGNSLKIKGTTKNRVLKDAEALCDTTGLKRAMHLVSLLVSLTEAPAKDLEQLSDINALPPMHQQEVERLKRFSEYVQENLSDEIRLEAAAKIAGMAPASFSRFFHKKTGQTFQNYLITQRLNEARVLLFQSQDNIIEISHKCGFNNLSNFNRHFKSRFGITPQQMREKYQPKGKF